MGDGEFVSHVQDALKHQGAQELADQMSVSLLTVIRWSKGENLPYQAMRPWILKFVKTV